MDAQYRLVVSNTLFQQTMRAAIGRDPLVGECILDLPVSPILQEAWRTSFDRALRGETFTTRIVILSMHADEPYIRESLRAGASGYVLKDAQAAEFIIAIRTAATGGRILPRPDYRRSTTRHTRIGGHTIVWGFAPCTSLR